MKIGFVVAGTFLSGGSYVIMQHAVRISRRSNHQVFMIMKEKMMHEDLYWFPDARELTWLQYEEAKNIKYDCLIATWWMTCYELDNFESKAYLYFSQSVESKFFSNNDILMRKYADSTYLLGLNTITEATWIRDYLRTMYGIDAELVKNGIDKSVFTEVGFSLDKRRKDKLRVLVEGNLESGFKNIPKTLDLCRKSRADEIWLLTGSAIDSYPGVDKVISRIPIDKTPEVYRSCDVLVKLSYVEGMFGPPLEMFHCGGTAIVYDVTGHDEYIENDVNAFVVKTDDDDSVISYINKLKDEPRTLARLKKGAMETASKWHNWDNSSIEFENAVERCFKKKQLTQKQMEFKIKHFKEWYINNAMIESELIRMNELIESLKKEKETRNLFFVALQFYKKHGLWAVFRQSFIRISGKKK